MNTLMKKNGAEPATPFSGLVDKLFQNNVNRFFDDDFWGFTSVTHAGNIPVNLRETANSYELELVAPGLRKEDFKVSINGKTLTIAYQKQEQGEQQSDEDGWLRREYKLRSFNRFFELDDTVEFNKIAAQYTDGILHLSIPKKETARAITRSIEIS